MRKLKLQVQISVDGFIAGPNGEMDWMVWDWDQELKDFVDKITSPVDTIVLGRKLAEGFIPYWKEEATKPNAKESGAEKFTETPKVVFTRTLDTSKWENTTLAKGSLTSEIKRLKTENGNDIIAYGGAEFVSSLIKEGLIDEYYFFVNPNLLGNGMPIFNELKDNQNLSLIEATAFACGITVLHYKTS